MSTVEEAGRKVAEAEEHRARAEGLVQATVEAHTQALQAHAVAERALADAHAQLIEAVYPPLIEKTVKRPASTADQLLGLDDVGGH